MAGQRLLPNPARLTQQKQPPNHTNPPRPHTPSSLPCAYPNRTPNASAPKLARMTRRLQKLFFVPLADQKEAAVAVLPASPCPLWTKGVAVAVLRGPSRPFVDQKEVAVAVLRGPSRPFVDKKEVAVAVLRGPSRPFVDQKEVAVAVLRGPSRPFVDQKEVAVLRGPPWPSVDKRCCRCSSSRSFAALRGQKEVAVAVFRHPPQTKK